MEWSNTRFSPDGKSVFFSTQDFDGIWEYSLSTKSTRQITNDPGSGYGFDISPNGNSIVYRRTLYENNFYKRKQEIIQIDLITNESKIIDKGEDVSIPNFINENIVYSLGIKTKNLSLSKGNNQPKILGIENTKIIIIRNGLKKLLDPFGNGSYIWPSLSPDNEIILAFEISKGAFICDLDGKILSILGKSDAPVWTKSGKWIIYMNEKDDGHKILSSDLYCISSNGKRTFQLTSTPEIMEMYPNCSPTENKIICSSLEGDIYILSYEETGE
jgi:Tol biopolymer transport system component